MNYEIYEGRTGKQNRKKVYLVFPYKTDITTLFVTARRHFKCRADHIELARGWVLNDELYREDPHKRGTKIVAIAFWCK